MYKFMLMEPTNQTFQELVANGIKYTVPSNEIMRGIRNSGKIYGLI
jgi:hypothetical protein